MALVLGGGDGVNAAASADDGSAHDDGDCDVDDGAALM